MDYEKYYINFCKNFRALCHKSNLTLTDVENATGISHWDLLLIATETYSETIPLKTLFKICELFNVSPCEMLK
ncbi:MAG: helix-turn-helix transcriptional regulator [Ruminococcus sp.]|nr:helix-turn-helix transcriptional regulator [Ruminococcus sp.]